MKKSYFLNLIFLSIEIHHAMTGSFAIIEVNFSIKSYYYDNVMKYYVNCTVKTPSI